MNLDSFAERVVIINLRRRPDRLQAFFDQEQMKDWPFKIPTIHEACDGWKCKPATWGSGSGSYGCCVSHKSVLLEAMEDRVESLFVLEDDAYLCPQFLQKATEFFSHVPPDWDSLWIGGQHRSGKPPEVMPGILRCNNAQRTHAYLIRGECLAHVYHLWNGMTSGHIDHLSGQWQPKFNVYAPDPFLIGQAAGKSDITCREAPLRFWSNVKIFGNANQYEGRTRHRHIRLKDTIQHALEGTCTRQG